MLTGTLCCWWWLFGMTPLVRNNLNLIETRGFAGYELVDSGGGRKLERFGAITVDRPEPQALWQPRLPRSTWERADAVFSASGEDEEKGKWRLDRAVPDSWPVDVDGVRILCRLQGLWHLGLFPEQQPHWHWMLKQIEAVKVAGIERPRVLNLFGYTGAASLLAAAAGAEVVHVDASKKAIQWGRDNQAASKLDEAPIRWILDDARKFTAREVRRERDYHILLVDPPKFGRGPKNETWDLFTDLPELLSDCARLASAKSAAMVLTVYAIRASSVAFAELTSETFTKSGGVIDFGELAIRSKDGRAVVPTSLFVRWASHA